MWCGFDAVGVDGAREEDVIGGDEDEDDGDEEREDRRVGCLLKGVPLI